MRQIFVQSAARLHDHAHLLGEGPFVLVHGGAVQPARRSHAPAVDRLHAAEVEERDATVRLEDVVAGMRIGVEHAADQVAFEDEAPQRSCVGAALGFATLGRFVQAEAGDELAREHARAGALGDHRGHENLRVALERFGRTRFAGEPPSDSPALRGSAS